MLTHKIPGNLVCLNSSLFSNNEMKQSIDFTKCHDTGLNCQIVQENFIQVGFILISPVLVIDFNPA